MPSITSAPGVHSSWNDVWLLDGVRTPFAAYREALSLVSPIDLGIKAAREVFRRSGISPLDAGTVVAGSVAQASFDAYLLPRHIGLYSGMRLEAPAHLVQRVCGTGIECIMQAADAAALGRVNLALCAGAESMSRNPIAAYTHRTGFRLGQLEFGDFLWESLLDPAAALNMGGTAENLARRYGISREDADRFAARSFSRALAARDAGFFSGEIVPVVSESFEREGLQSRGIRLSSKMREFSADTHLRPSPLETLAGLRPAFDGVQTGGNSSGIVDGAAAALVSTGDYARSRNTPPLARIVAGVSIGVEPACMGIGPAPAIKALVEHAGLKLTDIGRIEINEAFAAQVLACCRELGLDEDRLNVNGGAIALGHPLAATGLRLSITLAREMKRASVRYGVASACIGGGQGIALLLENPA